MSLRQQIRWRTVPVVGLALVGLIGLRVLSNLIGNRRAALPLNPDAVHVGTEWEAVLVVNSQCIPSSDPRLPSAVRSILQAVYRQAHVQNESMTTVGAVTDLDPRDGLRFLAQFGEFDQVIAGRGYRSMGYDLTRDPNDSDRPMGTPTLVVRSHTLSVSPNGQVAVGHDSIIVALLGTNQIVHFAEWIEGRGSWEPSGQVPRDASTVPLTEQE